VLTTAQHGGHLYALVESVAWRDQPPGLRTFVQLDPGYEPRLRLDERAAIAAGPPEDFAARLASAPAPVANDSSDPDALVAQLKGGLLPSLAPDAAFGREWPPFFESVQRPDVGTLAKLGTQVFMCLIEGCFTFDASDRLATLHVVETDAKRVVVAVGLSPPRSLPRDLVKPHLVHSVPDDGTLARAIRLLGIDDARLLGAAPLSPKGGMIGVVATGDGAFAFKEILIEDDVVVALDVSTLVEEKGVGVGFADLDGDGRTDFVLSGSYGSLRERSARMFLSPPSAAELDSPLVQEPIGFFAMRGARSVEAARARAIAAPSGGVTRAEACPLVKALEKQASAARVLAPQAVFFTYNASAWFEGSAKQASMQRILGETPCDSLECSASRPTCKHSDPPLTDYFLFRRDGGVLKIAGVIRYTGS
jgi:hypothetical protein